MAAANGFAAAADRITSKLAPIIRDLDTAGLRPIEQNHRVWPGPDSSNDSQNSDRESLGTPTPNPTRSTQRILAPLAAISSPTPDPLDLPDNIPPSSQIPKSTSSASETNSCNHNEETSMQLYDQYDLTAFNKEEFDMLLELAPPDQIPEIMTSEIEVDSPDLPDMLKAVYKDVNRYVLSHEFVYASDVTHSTSERRAFTRNVYDYARAKGLTKPQARDEVRRARMICGERDYDTDESSLGIEIDDTMEILEDLAKTTIHSIPGQYTLGHTDNPFEQEHQKAQSRGYKRRRKSQAVDKQEAGIAQPIQDGRTGEKQSHKSNHKKAKSAPNNLKGTEISTSTSPGSDAQSQHVEKKRKRQDSEPGNDTLEESKKRGKKKRRTRRSPHISTECATAGQNPTNADADPVIAQIAEGIAPSQAMTNVRNQATFQANEQAILSAVRGEKESNEHGVSLTPTREGQKALKREKKRKRRREKHVAESKGISHGETTKSEGAEPPVDSEGVISSTRSSASAVEDKAKAAKETRKAEKLARKVEKRKKRAEKAKHKEQVQELYHSMEPPKNVVPALGRGETSSKPVMEFSEAPTESEENRAPGESAAAKKNKKRKSIANQDSTETTGTPTGNYGEIVPPKDIGPNDPKSQEEAHRNYMTSNKHDPQEHVLTPDKTPKELRKAGEKSDKFIAKLGALKRFSNEKQLQLYEDGRYDNADKQTKDDLKDLREEKTVREEMEGSHLKVSNGLEERQVKKPKKTKVKAELASKNKDDVEQVNNEMGEATPSDAQVKKKRKRDQVKQEISSHTEKSDFY
ncbi:MAG: hypothetical protein M1830_007704 [Pleopsidium flavum]|nr:MAG: hypothetical protein M1830_007704 [Pleopsidium flavum]